MQYLEFYIQRLSNTPVGGKKTVGNKSGQCSIGCPSIRDKLTYVEQAMQTLDEILQKASEAKVAQELEKMKDESRKQIDLATGKDEKETPAGKVSSPDHVAASPEESAQEDDEEDDGSTSDGSIDHSSLIDSFFEDSEEDSFESEDSTNEDGKNPDSARNNAPPLSTVSVSLSDSFLLFFQRTSDLRLPYESVSSTDVQRIKDLFFPNEMQMSFAQWVQRLFADVNYRLKMSATALGVDNAVRRRFLYQHEKVYKGRGKELTKAEERVIDAEEILAARPLFSFVNGLQDVLMHVGGGEDKRDLHQAHAPSSTPTFRSYFRPLQAHAPSTPMEYYDQWHWVECVQNLVLLAQMIDAQDEEGDPSVSTTNTALEIHRLRMEMQDIFDKGPERVFAACDPEDNADRQMQRLMDSLFDGSGSTKKRDQEALTRHRNFLRRKARSGTKGGGTLKPHLYSVYPSNVLDQSDYDDGRPLFFAAVDALVENPLNQLLPRTVPKPTDPKPATVNPKLATVNQKKQPKKPTQNRINRPFTEQQFLNMMQVDDHFSILQVIDEIHDEVHDDHDDPIHDDHSSIHDDHSSIFLPEWKLCEGINHSSILPEWKLCVDLAAEFYTMVRVFVKGEIAAYEGRRKEMEEAWEREENLEKEDGRAKKESKSCTNDDGETAQKLEAEEDEDDTNIKTIGGQQATEGSQLLLAIREDATEVTIDNTTERVLENAVVAEPKKAKDNKKLLNAVVAELTTPDEDEKKTTDATSVPPEDEKPNITCPPLRGRPSQNKNSELFWLSKKRKREILQDQKNFVQVINSVTSMAFTQFKNSEVCLIASSLGVHSSRTPATAFSATAATAFADSPKWAPLFHGDERKADREFLRIYNGLLYEGAPEDPITKNTHREKAKLVRNKMDAEVDDGKTGEGEAYAEGFKLSFRSI